MLWPSSGDDALVAGHVGALVDGEREMAAAEQLRRRGAPRPTRGEPLGVEARIGAHAVGRLEIDDQHVDRAVGARLQLKAAFELQRSAQQDGQHDHLAHQPRHRRGIGVAFEDAVDDGPEAHDAAARIEGFDRERA